MDSSTRIENRIGVKATSDTIWSLVGDLATWSQWTPIETGAEGRIGYGGSVSLTEAIPGMPERKVVGRIGDWWPYAQLIWHERRGWQFNAMRYFEIEELVPGNCIVANGVWFGGFRGEFFHDKHRKQIKDAYIHVGEALKAAAEAIEAA